MSARSASGSRSSLKKRKRSDSRSATRRVARAFRPPSTQKRTQMRPNINWQVAEHGTNGPWKIVFQHKRKSPRVQLAPNLSTIPEGEAHTWLIDKDLRLRIARLNPYEVSTKHLHLMNTVKYPLAGGELVRRGKVIEYNQMSGTFKNMNFEGAKGSKWKAALMRAVIRETFLRHGASMVERTRRHIIQHHYRYNWKFNKLDPNGIGKAALLYAPNGTNGVIGSTWPPERNGMTRVNTNVPRLLASPTMQAKLDALEKRLQPLYNSRNKHNTLVREKSARATGRKRYTLKPRKMSQENYDTARRLKLTPRAWILLGKPQNNAEVNARFKSKMSEYSVKIPRVVKL